MKKLKIERILIPIDFSETSLLAIEHGAFMAKLYKADLILLHIIEKNWEPFSIVEPGIILEKPGDISGKVEVRLAEIAENIRKDYGVSSTVICSDGNICTEIVSVSKEKSVDFVVMGTHGVSGFEEFFIGSNTYKVVTMSEIPVVSVQVHSTRIGFNNIIVPIDNSNHSRQKVAHALLLAKHYGSKIHVLGLLNSDDEASDENKFKIKLEQVQHYFEKHGIITSSTTVKGTNHAGLTIEYSTKANADLIITMTDQVEEGIFLGAYAQQIVNHSKIPVMSITPEVHSENLPWVNPF